MEDIIFLTSLSFLIVVIFCGVVAMSLAKTKQMSNATIEDIESRLASYKESCELVHGKFTEYQEDTIHGYQQQAGRILPRRVVTSDAATDTNIAITQDGSSETNATPHVIVGAIELLSVCKTDKPDSVNSDKITYGPLKTFKMKSFNVGAILFRIECSVEQMNFVCSRALSF